MPTPPLWSDSLLTMLTRLTWPSLMPPASLPASAPVVLLRVMRLAEIKVSVKFQPRMPIARPDAMVEFVIVWPEPFHSLTSAYEPPDRLAFRRVKPEPPSTISEPDW